MEAVLLYTQKGFWNSTREEEQTEPSSSLSLLNQMFDVFAHSWNPTDPQTQRPLSHFSHFWSIAFNIRCADIAWLLSILSSHRRRSSSTCCGVVAWRWSRDLTQLSQFITHIIKTVGSDSVSRIYVAPCPGVDPLCSLQHVSPATGWSGIQAASRLPPRGTRDSAEICVWEHTPFNLSQQHLLDRESRPGCGIKRGQPKFIPRLESLLDT